MQLKHKNHITAKSYHINRFGEVSTSFLFWYMQEIAWEHAKILGFGYDDLGKNELFWVLSRLLIKIDRRPKWTEEFTLETWSRGSDGFYAYRDYHFIDKEGKVFIKATSTWLVLDRANHKIQRLQKFNNFPSYQESVFGYNASKVGSAQTSEKPVFFRVLFNEIDINQHFTSGKYLEKINNSYSFDFHEKHELRELEINFMKEGMPNDSLAVNQQFLTDKEHLCSVIRENDSAELIKARLIWEECIRGNFDFAF